MTDLLIPATVTSEDIEIQQGGDFYWPLGIIATQEGITGPPVVRNTAYTVGDRVTPATPNGYAYSCSTAGTSHASNEPTWPLVVGKTVSDGTVTWTCAGTVADREYLIDTTGYSASMEIRQGDAAGTTQAEWSTTNGKITVGFTPSKWVIGTAYAVGDRVVPLLLNGYIYTCTVAGTSDASTEPTWPTTLGATVLDNSVRWRCELAETIDNGRVNNLCVYASRVVTEALTDWNLGTYTLKVFDADVHCILWIDGVAYLREQSTY